jgi:hypothetical protein
VNCEYTSLVDRLLKVRQIHETCYIGLPQLLGLNLYAMY